MKEIRGVCFLFSETGTEGGWWAVQEAQARIREVSQLSTPDITKQLVALIGRNIRAK
jgi:hypothetical protein